jgi:hypothetical protein
MAAQIADLKAAEDHAMHKISGAAAQCAKAKAGAHCGCDPTRGQRARGRGRHVAGLDHVALDARAHARTGVPPTEIVRLLDEAKKMKEELAIAAKAHPMRLPTRAHECTHARRLTMLARAQVHSDVHTREPDWLKAGR